MHRKLVAASLLVAALAALGALGASADSVVVQDPFIALIKEVEVQPFFPQLSETHRLLTFEMLTAAETNHLGQLLDLLGYIQLFKYLDALPKEFSHRFITYSITHLERELVAQS